MRDHDTFRIWREGMRRLRAIVVVSSLMLAAACLIGFSCYKFSHTYLISANPVPSRITVNGETQEFDPNGCFIFRELYGEHTIHVRYKDGSSITVMVFPRIDDDNSSSLTISKAGVAGNGDLKYRVIEQRGLH